MTPAGFPHSEISGSTDVCSSPELIAACRVLHRLPMPRHPLCALSIFLPPHIDRYRCVRNRSCILAIIAILYCHDANTLPQKNFKREAMLRCGVDHDVCFPFATRTARRTHPPFHGRSVPRAMQMSRCASEGVVTPWEPDAETRWPKPIGRMVPNPMHM